MKGPVERELDAWGPIVERMAVVEAAFQFGGYITKGERDELKALYGFVFLHTPAR